MNQINRAADVKPLLMVLDDENNDRLLLKSALKFVKQDVQAVFFRSAVELLTFLRHSSASHQNLYHSSDVSYVEGLIILDLSMPGSSGFDVLKELKLYNDLQGTPAVVMTGHASTENINESNRLGACGIIQKPTSFKVLVEIVNSLCDYWLYVSKTPRLLINVLKPADLLYSRPENSSCDYDVDQNLLLDSNLYELTES